jgi:mannose-6-phosphate isomerase-like protein (cupin superfamily)
MRRERGQREMEKVNLQQKFDRVTQHWSPNIVGEVNDCHVKIVKFQGAFTWHHHQNEDEMFLVTKGRFLMRFRDGDVEVGEGEFIIVPKGVEHLPVAEEEVQVVLFEPKTTLNTGNVRDAHTVEELDRI